MSEMIEQVARALCKAIGVPADELAWEPRRKEMLVAWQHQLPKARAAIEVGGVELVDQRTQEAWRGRPELVHEFGP